MNYDVRTTGGIFLLLYDDGCNCFLILLLSYTAEFLGIMAWAVRLLSVWHKSSCVSCLFASAVHVASLMTCRLNCRALLIYSRLIITIGGRLCRVLLYQACSGHLTSTLDVICALLTQPCWWYHPQMCLPSGFGTCVEHLPSSVRNAPSLTTFRRKLKTVLFQSSFDNDSAIVIVLHSITVFCPRLLTVGDCVVFVCFSF